MAKKVRLTSNSSLKKCENKRKVSNGGRINELPDEILLSILSHLHIKEAARTSVLSHRWDNLWTYISSLNFDASETLAASLQSYPETCESERRRERLEYASWVNQTLKSHQAPILEGFKICLDVTDTSAVDIDSWISFAIKKRVQRFELDFSRSPDFYWYHQRERYSIAAERFCFASFNSLKTICLKQVDLAQELFEDLLSNSPFLQHLSVDNCRTLVKLKVGPSSKLKYLEITSCLNVESIEIFALYLESFKYSGRKAIIFLKEAPQLIEVLFRVSDYMVMDLSRQVSRYLSQLRKIVWNLSYECCYRPYIPREFPKLPTLSNLKSLELQVTTGGIMDIHPIMSFLEASPFIHKFKFELQMLYFDLAKRTVPERKTPNVTKKHPYVFLKVVELIGFVGATEDLEITMYLLENAVSLEKLIISPFDFQISCMSSEIKEREKRLTRECAIELGTKLPSGADFIIL